MSRVSRLHVPSLFLLLSLAPEAALAEIGAPPERPCLEMTLENLREEETHWATRKLKQARDALKEKKAVAGLMGRIEEAKKNPQDRAKQAVERSDAAFAAFQANHPIMARFVSGITPDRLSEPVTYLKRAIGILTRSDEKVSEFSGTGKYDASNMWHRNHGIDAYNLSNLRTDPQFLAITQDVLTSIHEIDAKFEAKIHEHRYAKSIATSDQHGMLIDDLPAIQSFFEQNRIDVKELVLQRIIANLPPGQRKNAALIEDYFFKFALLFHDEATRSLDNGGTEALTKALGNVMYPSSLSIFYTNWLGVREAPAYLRAMRSLQSDIVELHRQNRHAFYGPGRFRLGYYHNAGATGVSGIASQGLFEGRGAGSQFGAVQARLALSYKTTTLNQHRDAAQKGLFEYIRRRYPEMYAKYVSGTLTFKDVMGTEVAGKFEGGFFDRLQQDQKLMSGDLWASVVREDGKVLRTKKADPAVIVSAIKNEQLLWLDLLRVPDLHRAAAEQIPTTRRWIRDRVRAAQAP